LPHQAIALQIRQNLGWKHLRPFAHTSQCAAKISLCPAITLKATIVLPDFIRSFSNDGSYTFLEKEILIEPESKKRRP
jgi:hypothetical protein